MAASVDVDGTTVTLPDPQVISDLAARFQAAGDQLGDAADQLSAVAAPQAVTPWTGGAADAFARTIGPLPGQLNAASDSYHAAAAALSQYADQVGPLVTTLTTLSGQAADAVGDLNATQAARNQLFAQDPFSPDLPALDARLASSQSNVTGLRAQARTAQADMEDAAKSCVTSINRASPKHSGHSLLGRLGHDVADVLKPAWHVADKVLVQPFPEAWHGVDNFIDHPSLKNLADALTKVTTAIGVLGLLVPGLGEVLAPFLIASMAGALLSDAGAVAEGEQTPLAGLAEAGKVALAGGGGVAEAGAASEQAVLRGVLDSDGADAALAVGDDRTIGDVLHGFESGADDRTALPSLLKGAVTTPFTKDYLKVAAGDAKGDLTQMVAHPLDFLADRGAGLRNLDVNDALTHSPNAATLQQAGLGIDVVDLAVRAVEPEKEQHQ
jgi:uncharacterized protein YukE